MTDEITQHKNHKGTDDYVHKSVPKENRQIWWIISMVWTAAYICIPMIHVGIEIGRNLSYAESLTAILTGCFLLSLIFSITGYIGGQTGLNTSLILEITFGTRLATIPILIISVSLFGWFAYQAEVFGESLHIILQHSLNINVNNKLLAFCGGILMSITAIWGFYTIKWFSKISIALLAGIIFIPALIQYIMPASITSHHPLHQITTLSAILKIISSMIVGATLAPDINRWSSTGKHAIIANVFSFFIFLSILLLTCRYFSTLSSNQSDFISIMYSVGWGPVAMIVLVFASWSTNDTNLHFSSLGISSILKHYDKKHIVLVSGITASLISILGVKDHFVHFLNILMIFFLPLLLSYTIDFFYCPSRYYPNPTTKKPYRWKILFFWLAMSISVAYLSFY